MSVTVRGLLQKINFIETDMDLHKQILLSISPKDTDQMEAVIRKIADQKRQIEQLRDNIKMVDEQEYNKIIAIEAATKTFQQMAANKKFVLVNTLNETGECFIILNDGTCIDCLVAAKEENGSWTVLTLEGQVREYPGSLIKIGSN